MSASLLDSELNKYWSVLTREQKESILNVIKSFIYPNEIVSLAPYNNEIHESVNRVESGEFISHEDVERMSKEWQ
ncbi:MAG: hypothetical protein ABIN89_06180 [Chitinophagaceae bacterium]